MLILAPVASLLAMPSRLLLMKSIWEERSLRKLSLHPLFHYMSLDWVHELTGWVAGFFSPGKMVSLVRKRGPNVG